MRNESEKRRSIHSYAFVGFVIFAGACSGSDDDSNGVGPPKQPDSGQEGASNTDGAAGSGGEQDSSLGPDAAAGSDSGMEDAGGSGGSAGSGGTDGGDRPDGVQPDQSATGGSAGTAGTDAGGASGVDGGGDDGSSDAPASDANDAAADTGYDAGPILSTTPPQLVVPERQHTSFGRTVAINGDWAVIAHEQDSLRIARRDSGQQWNLVANNELVDRFSQQPNSDFGYALAMWDIFAFVGAPGDPGFGGQSHFCERQPNDIWVNAEPPRGGGTTSSRFGIDVDGDSGSVIVGAPDNRAGVGAAFVYKHRKSGPFNVWDDFQEIVHPETTGAEFGLGVEIDGNNLAVCAPGRDGGQGGAYVYELGTNSWAYRQKLVPAPPTDAVYCAQGMALDGDTLLVGASSPGGGAVYTFTRNAGTWSADQSPLTPPLGLVQNPWRFGSKTVLCGDLALISHQTVDPADSDVVFYRRAGGFWNLLGALSQVLPTAQHSGLACDGNLIAVGDRTANGGAGGVHFFSLTSGSVSHD
jgi:hypothetical protein